MRGIFKWTKKPLTWPQRFGQPKSRAEPQIRQSRPTGLSQELEPPQKKRRKDHYRQRPACSLPAPDPGDKVALDEEEKKLKENRAKQKTTSQKVDHMALKLRAGRTLQTLLNIRQSGLLTDPVVETAGPLPPVAGLTATHIETGKEVVILDSFKRYKGWSCDVAPVAQKQGPKTTHKLLRRKVFTCKATALTDIGLKYRTVAIRKKVPLLVQIQDQDQLQQAQEELVHGSRAHSQDVQVDPLPATTQLMPPSFVLQVRPASAEMHAANCGHRVGPRQATSRSTVVVWQLPQPILLDCRPWRCFTCQNSSQRVEGTTDDDSVHYFRSRPEEIVELVPDALRFYKPKHGETWVHPSFLVHMLRCLYETMNFREMRRRLIDSLLSQALSDPGSNTAKHIHVLLAAFPSPHQLRSISLAVFPRIVKPRVSALQALQARYNGAGVRIDGHWKKARTITIYKQGTKRKGRSHPLTCLFAICGTDGSLLAPVRATRSESWPDISPYISEVLTMVVQERLKGGLPLPLALPAFVATDSYHKHKGLIMTLLQELGHLSRVATIADTPKSDLTAQAEILPPEVDTLVAGEPFHDVINARRCVSPKANDCSHFVQDHQELLNRLSAPLAPVSEVWTKEIETFIEINVLIRSVL